MPNRFIHIRLVALFMSPLMLLGALALPAPSSAEELPDTDVPAAPLEPGSSPPPTTTPWPEGPDEPLDGGGSAALQDLGSLVAEPDPWVAGPQYFTSPRIVPGQRYSHNFSDPFIMRVGSTYYAYATSTGGKNLPVLTSKDLFNWFAAGSGEAMPTPPPWADVDPIRGGAVGTSGHRHRRAVCRLLIMGDLPGSSMYLGGGRTNACWSFR